MIYIIGSLSNPVVETVADRLREEGFDVFDQWRAAQGDYWADYAKRRGMTFREAIAMDFTETAFQFDMRYLRKASSCVLVMPAGRSAGIELGWMLGQGKKGYILYDGEPERPDLMAKMATGIYFSVEELINELKSSEHQLDQVGHQAGGIYSITDFPTDGCHCAIYQRTDWGV
jgi:hypothetical protein